MNTLDFLTSIELDTNSIGIKVYENVDFNPSCFFSNIEKNRKLEVINSSDGKLSVVADNKKINDLSQNVAFFDFHTDGAYLDCIPDFVLLYCCAIDNDFDIPTIFCDTQKALEKMANENRNVLEKLCTSYIHKNMNIYVKNLVDLHPAKNIKICNLTNRSFVSPKNELNLEEIPPLKKINDALTDFFDCLEKSIIYTHIWNSKDLVIFDNRQFLHSRGNPIFKTGKENTHSLRKLYRIWVSRIK